MNGRIAALMESIKREAVLAAWPVGSIYTSTEATSPATLFGGTWERIKDRFLLAAGDTYSAGSTGGEASVTLTVEQMPSHHHTVGVGIDAGLNDMYWGAGEGSSARDGWASGIASPVPSNEVHARPTGGTKAHTNMPPYLAVYAWKRTA